MILKELHLTDALERISIFSLLTHNGEVRILTWPQVIDISKIRGIQIVGTSGLIKFWKLEKILLRTVAVARAYAFLEVRSRDSTWWPDLMWPRHKNFTTDVKLINEKVCQVWLRCSLSFSSYPRNTTGGGGAKWPPPPTRAKVKPKSDGILTKEHFKSFRFFFRFFLAIIVTKLARKNRKTVLFCQNGQHFGNSTLFDHEGADPQCQNFGQKKL